MKGFFITGTDTAVGKTYFTALLTRALRQINIPAIPLKPISTGDRSDAILLSDSISGSVSPAEINPVNFPIPIAPYPASMLESRPFPWELLRNRLAKLEQDYPGPFLVEGIGGWRVPLDSCTSVREWAQELQLPVLVVARAGLGTLNHTLLTVDSIRAAKLTVQGIICNHHPASDKDMSIATNPGVLEQLTSLPVISLAASTPQLPSPLPPWLVPAN